MISVTRVLAPYTDFSKVPLVILKHAAKRGSRVHAACAAEARGLFVAPLDDECQPYFDSFCQWFEQCVEQVIAVEVEYVHRFGFIGHPDLVCIIKGDETPTVIDLKTPRALNRLWAAQLAAYVKLVQDNGIPAKRAATLRLKPNGGFPLLDEYTLIPDDWAGFLNAFYAHTYFKGEDK